MLAIKIVDRVINVIGEFLLLGLTHLYHRSISKPPPPPQKKNPQRIKDLLIFFRGCRKRPVT